MYYWLKKHIWKPNEPRLGLTVQEFKHVGQVNVLEYSYNGATIVQLEDILGNTSHCITIAGKWIFDSNFERGLAVSIESLHMCCTNPGDTTGHKHWFKRVVRIVQVQQLKNSKVYNNLL